jgi:hypothetical protein
MLHPAALTTQYTIHPGHIRRLEDKNKKEEDQSIEDTQYTLTLSTSISTYTSSSSKILNRKNYGKEPIEVVVDRKFICRLFEHMLPHHIDRE